MSDNRRNGGEIRGLVRDRGLNTVYYREYRRGKSCGLESHVSTRYAYWRCLPDEVPLAWVSEGEKSLERVTAWEARIEAEAKEREAGEVAAALAVERKSADGRRCMEWVAESLALAVVDEGSAPGSAAVALLRWVKGDKQAESEFWRGWMGRLPKEAAPDEDRGFVDDLRNLDRLMGKLKEWKGEQSG